MIEVMKYLFLGESTYIAEAPPRRLRNNPLWSKEKIKALAESLLAQYEGNLDDIIGRLRSARNAEHRTAPRLA